MGLDANAHIYVGAEIVFDDLFVVKEVSSDCACINKVLGRKYCSECGCPLGDMEVTYAPKWPDLFGLKEGQVLDEEEMFDLHRGRWWTDLPLSEGGGGIHYLFIGHDVTIILGYKLSVVDMCIRGGAPAPYRIHLGALTHYFRKTQHLLAKHGLGENWDLENPDGIQLWVNGGVSHG